MGKKTYVVIGATDSRKNIGWATTREINLRGNISLTVDKSNCDVRSEDDIRTLIESAGILEDTGEIPPVAGYVYCAGVNYLSWLPETELVHVADIFATNVIGFINLMSNLSDKRSSPLNIIAVSSDAAERPMRTSTAYCASKAALNMAVRCAARELGPVGWSINAVAPGMVEGTGMSSDVDAMISEVRGWTAAEAGKYESSQEVVPGRIPPEDVARVICDVLEMPPHVNGSIFTINGGR